MDIIRTKKPRRVLKLTTVQENIYLHEFFFMSV